MATASFRARATGWLPSSWPMPKRRTCSGSTPTSASRPTPHCVSCCRGREVVAGVYPHKRDGWPAEGLARGAAGRQHARRLRSAARRLPAQCAGGHARRRRRRFRRSAGRAHGLHADRPHRLRAHGRRDARTALYARRRRGRAGGLAALPLLRPHGRTGERPLPERGLRLLPPLAGAGRQGLCADTCSRLDHQGLYTWAGDLPRALAARAR